MTEHQGDCSGGDETDIRGKRVKLLTCSGGNETGGESSQSTAVYIHRRTIDKEERTQTQWETYRTMKVVLE